MRAAHASALLVAALLGTAPAAWACSCAPHEPVQRLAESDAVFVGRVTAVRPLETAPSGACDALAIEAHLEVLERFKGAGEPQARVWTLAPERGNCGVRLIPGERYLVYVDGAQPLDLCGGTRRIAGAEVDQELAELRAAGRR